MQKRLLFSAISVFLGLVFAIALIEIVLRLLPVNEAMHRLPVDESNPVVRFKESRDFIWSRGWNFSVLAKKHTNNYGFLNDEDYQEKDSTPLMAIIGDSFVEASQVENKHTMYGILSRKVVGTGRIYSFGSSSAPLSTYLAYANYACNRFHPNSIVFVIISNDFHESLLKYYTVRGNSYFIPDNNGQFLLKRLDFQPTMTKKIARKFALFRYIFLNLGWNWKQFEQWMHFSPKKPKKSMDGIQPLTMEELVTDTKSSRRKCFSIPSLLDI